MSEAAPGAALGANPAADVCVPFLVNGGAFRGRLVRLVASVTDIFALQKNPEPVSALLAEAMAAAVALAGGLKYTGVFTLQVQGKGPVNMMVTDVTSAGELRACVKFDAEAVEKELARPRPHLLGPGGHLAFTVDQGPDTERYQGIVELSGESLADAVHHYFRQSEQLDSALKVAVAPPAAPGQPWIAAALLLQRMPLEGGLKLISREDLEDAWRTAVILLGSLKNSELLDLALTPERLLTRLFITIGVVPGARRAIRFQCRCSRERSERILASFPVEEVRSYADDGKVHMTCEYCHSDYVFDVADLEAIVHKHRTEIEKG
jgi:molecular chaperone Hsp33